MYRLPSGEFYNFDNFCISNDTIAKLRYDPQLVALLSSYNEALSDVRKAIADYNRIVYPISDQAFTDRITQGWRISDPDWDEAKQKMLDEYDANSRKIVEEVVKTYDIADDATVGDTRANTTYQADLGKQCERTTQRADDLLAIIKKIENRREYYDIALEV